MFIPNGQSAVICNFGGRNVSAAFVRYTVITSNVLFTVSFRQIDATYSIVTCRIPAYGIPTGMNRCSISNINIGFHDRWRHQFEHFQQLAKR
jgi:hypothetical protein